MSSRYLPSLIPPPKWPARSGVRALTVAAFMVVCIWELGAAILYAMPVVLFASEYYAVEAPSATGLFLTVVAAASVAWAVVNARRKAHRPKEAAHLEQHREAINGALFIVCLINVVWVTSLLRSGTRFSLPYAIAPSQMTLTQWLAVGFGIWFQGYIVWAESRKPTRGMQIPGLSGEGDG